MASGDAAPIAAKDAAGRLAREAQLDCSGGIVAGASRAGSRADRTSSKARSCGRRRVAATSIGPGRPLPDVFIPPFRVSS